MTESQKLTYNAVCALINDKNISKAKEYASEALERSDIDLKSRVVCAAIYIIEDESDLESLKTLNAYDDFAALVVNKESEEAEPVKTGGRELVGILLERLDNQRKEAAESRSKIDSCIKELLFSNHRCDVKDKDIKEISENSNDFVAMLSASFMHRQYTTRRNRISFETFFSSNKKRYFLSFDEKCTTDDEAYNMLYFAIKDFANKEYDRAYEAAYEVYSRTAARQRLFRAAAHQLMFLIDKVNVKSRKKEMMNIAERFEEFRYVA